MPQVAQAQLNLGIALYQQQKYEESSVAFQSATKIDPTNALALKYMKLLQSGDSDQASALTRRFVDLSN